MSQDTAEREHLIRLTSLLASTKSFWHRMAIDPGGYEAVAYLQQVLAGLE